MKEYTIIYKNGNTLNMKAYSIEMHDGKYYVCGKAYAGDGPEWYTIKADHIQEIKAATGNN